MDRHDEKGRKILFPSGPGIKIFGTKFQKGDPGRNIHFKIKDRESQEFSIREYLK